MGDGRWGAKPFAIFPFVAFAMKRKVLIEMGDRLTSISRKFAITYAAKAEKNKAMRLISHLCLAKIHCINAIKAEHTRSYAPHL